MQNDSLPIIRKLFDYFYYKFYKRVYSLNVEREDNKKIISNFVNLLSKKYNPSSLGVNWWIEYFSFSWSYWSTKKTKRDVSLNWIIGKKMLQKWLDRPDTYSYHYHQFLKEYNIDINSIRQELIDQEIIQHELDPAEEQEKSRFGGSGDAQLYHCYLYTTLYNKRSPICLTCDNKVICKKLLIDTNPKLYKKRYAA